MSIRRRMIALEERAAAGGGKVLTYQYIEDEHRYERAVEALARTQAAGHKIKAKEVTWYVIEKPMSREAYEQHLKDGFFSAREEEDLTAIFPNLIVSDRPIPRRAL